MNPDDPNQNPTQPQTPPMGDQPASPASGVASEGAPPVSEKCVTCGGASSGGNCVPCGQGQVSCTCPSAQGGGMPPPAGGGEQSPPTQSVV